MTLEHNKTVMGMDAQKILWAVAGVGLLAVVVLSGGLYLLRPREAGEVQQAAAAVIPPPGFDAFEFVRGTDPIPGIVTPVVPDDVVIVIGGRDAQPDAPTISLGSEDQRPAAVSRPQIVTQPTVVQPAPAAVRVNPAMAPAASAPVVRPAAATARPAPAAAAASPYEFWIQVGSFASQALASTLSDQLGREGLVGRITTRDADGAVMYRVRVGPYGTQDEADKFLTWVKGVPDLASSYVSRVSR